MGRGHRLQPGCSSGHTDPCDGHRAPGAHIPHRWLSDIAVGNPFYVRTKFPRAQRQKRHDWTLALLHTKHLMASLLLPAKPKNSLASEPRSEEHLNQTMSQLGTWLPRVLNLAPSLPTMRGIWLSRASPGDSHDSVRNCPGLCM